MNNTFKPWYFIDSHSPEIENVVKPLEIAQYSIIISRPKQNSIYDPYYKFHRLEFRCKHSRKIVRVTDSIITPEMIVLYVNKDTRKYPYKKCVLVSKLDYDEMITNKYSNLKIKIR